MAIALTPQQQAWLEVAVAEGRFASVEDGVQEAVDQLMLAWAHPPIDPTDDDWVKPLIDEGLASLERGEGMSLDEWRAHRTKVRNEQSQRAKRAES